MNERTHSTTLRRRSLMRKCTINDFSSRGVKITPAFSKSISKRVCPNIVKEDHEMYKIRNDYSNETLRNSFSVEILTCTN